LARLLSDDALVHLRDLGKLTILNLSRTKVSGPGLVHLKNLPRFDQLILDGTPITDAGLRCLVGTDRPKSLSLNHPAITDEAAACLKDLKGLEFLALDSTKATEAIIPKLKDLPRLKAVIVAGKTVAPVNRAGPRQGRLLHSGTPLDRHLLLTLSWSSLETISKVLLGRLPALSYNLPLLSEDRKARRSKDGKTA
jgi:hypothetical protein